MLTIDTKALVYISKKKQSIYLDIPPIISNCCMTIRESPAVRFGKPYNLEYYTKATVQGVTVFVPHDLPQIPLTITVSRFFWHTRLAVEGWVLA